LGYAMGFRISHWSMLPLAIICMFSMALLFSLLGTSLAAKFDDMQSFPTIMNFLVMPMIFISGALFPPDNFPPILKIVIKFNPFTYSTNLLKFGLGVPTGSNHILDICVVAGLIIILGSIGTWLFNRMET